MRDRDLGLYLLNQAKTEEWTLVNKAGDLAGAGADYLLHETRQTGVSLLEHNGKLYLSCLKVNGSGAQTRVYLIPRDLAAAVRTWLAAHP